MLDDHPFTYILQKSGGIRICWNGRPVKTLSAVQAGRLLPQLRDAAPLDVQLTLAKITGNFKRGNEKAAKRQSKRQ